MAVHTLAYLRRTSTLLLVSVLASAAKFFRPDLHNLLSIHAQTLITRNSCTGSCELGLIQSLMIAVYWKAPTDRSCWVKLGIAIRLAYQAGLHVKPQRILPANVPEAREVLVSHS
jgi:hypothetical protein